MKYNKTTPCDNCPFRHDVPPFLTPERAEELAHCEGEFPCHKTTVEGDDDDGERHETPKSQHCAGFLIMREKAERPSQMMRIAERLGFYDRRKLDMDAPVYEDQDAMIEAYYEADDA